MSAPTCVCDVSGCGREFATETGLAVHRAHAHRILSASRAAVKHRHQRANRLARAGLRAGEDLAPGTLVGVSASGVVTSVKVARPRHLKSEISNPPAGGAPDPFPPSPRLAGAALAICREIAAESDQLHSETIACVLELAGAFDRMRARFHELRGALVKSRYELLKARRAARAAGRADGAPADPAADAAADAAAADDADDDLPLTRSDPIPGAEKCP